MKIFNYTARDKSGSTKRGSLQAADRNAAMQELSAQGMVPLSITEGVAQSGNKAVKPVYAITAGIAGLIIVAVAVMILFQGGVIPKTAEGKKGVSTKTASVARAQQNKKPVQLKVPVVETNTAINFLNATNALTSIVTNNPVEVAADVPVANTNKQTRMFSSGTEQVISWIVNAKLGDMPPPLPNLPVKEDIVAILNRDIILYDYDNEATAGKKANVAHAKQLLKEYLAQGGKPEEFLNFFRDELKKAHNEWKDAQFQTMTLYKDGNHQEALKYAEEQNKKLGEKGIKPVVVPRAIREQ